jgi:ATP/maltotriose-dependent transcriptional regulator MalT
MGSFVMAAMFRHGGHPVIGVFIYPLVDNRGVDAPPLIGREPELAALAGALERVRAGAAGALVVEGEPGIGKSRLLAELAQRAERDGGRVAGARASEAELDLPYAAFTEALVPPLRERRLDGLGLDDAAALAGFLDPLATLAEPEPADGHRVHRALRELLAALAGPAPLLLWLDDVHWLDPASADALGALIRRLPPGRVLVAAATREGQAPAPVAAAAAAALRDGTLVRVAPAPLDAEQAAELVGPAAAAIYADSGGNPFYLEQLARAQGGREALHLDGVPDRVAGALASELLALPALTRVLLDAAAVIGDPFDPELAAEVAELEAGPATAAVDGLVQRTLVRTAALPGRFAFRHPVVRRAVYEAAPAGWRVAAHGRAAAALQRRGASPVARAHHVEHAARPGDEDAIALLATAADALQSAAPASSARIRAAALHLLPAADAERRQRMAIALADAHSAAGDPARGRETLLDLLDGADAAQRIALGVRAANLEYWLGHHDEARERYHVALQSLPAAPSGDRIRLHLGLALSMLLARDFDGALAHAADARDDARALGDPVVEAAALACAAAAATALRPGDAEPADTAAAAFAALTDIQAVVRLPGLWMLGRANRALGRFDAGLEHLERGVALARATGRSSVLLVLRAEAAGVQVELGRIGAAVQAAQEATDLAALLGSPPMHVWAYSALSSALLAAGDATGALRAAQEAAVDGHVPDFQASGQPAWARGNALVAGGHAEDGAEALRAAVGGAGMPALAPSERPAAFADLVEAGDVGAAPEAANAFARALVLRAQAQALLAAGDARAAAEHAAAAQPPSAPLAAARARLVEGQALAALGDRAGARAALTDAAEALERAGAERWRSLAVRELRSLGHRVRRARAGAAGGLTARERTIAELAAAGRTNREIAEELVLSVKTVEAHLRNIFGKLGVRRRIELSRALQEPRA